MRIVTVLLMLVLVGGILFAQEEKAEEPGEDVATGGMTFWQTIAAGGAAMAVIGLCSVLTLAIVIERIGNLRVSKVVPKKFVEEAGELASQQKYDEIIEKCEETPCPVSNIFNAALETRGEGKDKVIEAVEDAGAKEMGAFQDKIMPLSIIAVISPMIGLLGTVLGMIQAFNVIAYKAGLGKPTLLAEGISKALVTTAGGLIVAIPAMVAYHFLRSKSQRIMVSIEKISERFIGLLFPSGEGIAAGEALEEKTLEQ